MEKDILRFEPEKYIYETITCKGHEIVCKTYQGLTYVAKPVDAEYQSLNIYIPLTIDGTQIDTTDAPIVLQNMCNGYNAYRINHPRQGHPFPQRPEPEDAPKIGPAPGRPGYRGFDRDKMYTPLMAGFILVVSGNRGRDNFADGRYFGKAPAPIVDLKAAVRYIRHNAAVLPGSTEHIISIGASAGGAVSALLGASGNDADYESYLAELGAAEERDDVFASVCISPVLDLEHQDIAYEWQYGKLKHYTRKLELDCRGDYGKLTPEIYKEYYLNEFVIPSAEKWLREQDGETVRIYLEDRPWIHWDGKNAGFTFEDYEEYLGRLKGLAAFDTFEFGKSENTLFGTDSEPAAHFAEFTVRHVSGDPHAAVDPFVARQRDLMNPLTRLREHNGKVAQYWWIRAAAKENGFALPIAVNAVAQLDKMGKEVNFRLVWDGGHCYEDDRPDMLRWIEEIVRKERQNGKSYD